ncbi:hypothetical protein BDV32DRAFT_146807 [Aspergillus pseudonomiae]|nr:hypothetical protein BDV32DRAFT_146807 [Aspergillus pseudonomiae]
MIDFELSDTQTRVREHARSFATKHLTTAHTLYENLPIPQARFSAIRPLYEQAVKAGLIQAQVPTEYNGRGYGLVDMALLTERLSSNLRDMIRWPLLLAPSFELVSLAYDR